MRQQSGYTLIELLLYLALTGILLGGLMMFFAMSTAARVKNQNIMEVEQQGSFIVDTITQATRGADSITSPTTGTSGSSVTVVTSGSSTVFSPSGTVFQIKEGTAAAIPLSNNRVQVSNFTVKNLSRTGSFGTVQISLTLSAVNNSGRSEYDYQKTFTTSASLR